MEIRDVLKTSSLPRLEIEILLAFLLHKSREFLLTHPNFRVSPSAFKRFKSLEVKRLKDWPIAYLIGSKEFYGLDFKVSPSVLTPRPETEKIVDDMIDIFKPKTSTSAYLAPILKPIVIDLGTGSGAIIISVAKELKRLAPAAYRRAEFLAVDISAPALKVAKANAAHHGLGSKIKFYKGDLLAPLKLGKRDLSRYEIIIAANLPYLTPQQIRQATSISREPLLALDGGSDGLKYYRVLFMQLSHLPAIRNLRIICEIDDAQAAKIKSLTARYFPHLDSEIVYDLSGKKRYLALR